VRSVTRNNDDDGGEEGRRPRRLVTVLALAACMGVEESGEVERSSSIGLGQPAGGGWQGRVYRRWR